MIPRDFVYTASAIAGAVLAFLLLANLLIIIARMAENHKLAQQVIRILQPFANLFRVPGKNSMDNSRKVAKGNS